jgi:uncharacterized protein (TIGR03000 family)
MPKGGEPVGKPKDETLARGTIQVILPADATLTVDGMPTSSTSSVRTFVTPTLQPGAAYHYMLRAQITRNGQTVQVERRVPVAAGQTSRVTMEFPAAPQRVASR